MCGAVETVFRTEPQADPCESCGISKLTKHEESCFACGSSERVAARSFQGCSSCSRFWMGAEGSKDRSYLAPRCCVRAGELHWRECLAGNPGPGPFHRHLLVQLHRVRPVVGSAGRPCLRVDQKAHLASMDPEKVPFETCLLQKPGESWTIWGDLRSHQSAVLEDALPVTERLQDKTRAEMGRLAGWLRDLRAEVSRGWPPDSINTVSNPCYHIVESWDIEKMMEEPPTDAYYEALGKDLHDRHKKACPHLLDHLVSLEAFLDKSILFGFSFGINKAEVCVAEGRLLGHKIGRHGSAPDEERRQAVVDFPPLKEKLHTQQFLGCANWLRGYLPAEYGHVAAKVLGQWQKPGAVFPEGGLGSAASEGCKAFRAIKKMMQQHICLAAFDEASAADGSCPLEQIADASGIAVGGSVVQMSRDLSKLKVLMTHSKSLTPAQQNWPPLIQEAFAQLEVKRATRKTFGSIRTLCWTDHANLTRAQTSDIGMDPKLVRWVAEILMDGSEIRSLSGRSATLGDSFSKTPRTGTLC